MPVGPIGTVWKEGSWLDTVWNVGTWRDAVDAVEDPVWTRMTDVRVRVSQISEVRVRSSQMTGVKVRP